MIFQDIKIGRIIIITLFFLATSLTYAQQQKGCKEIKNKKAKRVFEDAVNKYHVKLYRHAVAKLNEAINIEPGYTDAYFLKGLIFIQEHNVNTQLAKKNFLKVIELCSTYNVYAYYYLADIYFGEENYKDAVENYSKFLEDVDKIKTDEDYYRARDLLEYSKFLLRLYNNPVNFNPRYVKGISTKEDEYLPIISPDGEIALFTRKSPMPSKKRPWQHGKVYQEKFMASRKRGKYFDNGKEMPQPFNLERNEGGATLTIDNNHLYYTVCRFAELDSGSYYNCDIFNSNFVNGRWTSLENLGDAVNMYNTWESQPSISSDGNTLYFTSDRPGGIGGYDIYRSVRNKDGKWMPAENLGNTINSEGNEKSPFIHTDSQTLYFSSDGIMGLGGYDIFYSKLDSNGIWSEPKNIGYPINTKSDEVGFFVSTNGKTGYFSSNKYNGPGGYDLYAFDLYEEARPEKVLFLKGKIENEDSLKIPGAKVLLKNVKTKEVEEIEVDTNSGKYVIAKQFKNDFIISVKKKGYTQTSKYISKEDTTFEEPAKVDMEVEKIEVGKAYTLEDIHFAYDSDKLTENSKLILDEFVKFLNENPSITFSIHGHTDNRGNDAYNLELSDRRAKSVQRYLLEKGIKAARMTAKGFGETRPIAPNTTDEGRAKNRRTEFFITGY